MDTRPYLFWWPGMLIVVISLAINFIGDGLRDAFDPRQSRGGSGGQQHVRAAEQGPVDTRGGQEG